MNTMLAISGSVIADAIRRKVVWVVVVFAAVLSFAIPSLPSYGAGVVEAVFREVSIALMFLVAYVIALSLSATRIPGEVERRTVFNILARDVRRWHYIVGTWAGMLAVVGVTLLAFTVVALVVGRVVYGELMLVLFEATFAVWLEIGVLMAFAVMMSARFGVVTSVVGVLAFSFIGHSVGSVFAQGAGGVAPWYVPSLDVFNVINPVAHGAGYGSGYVGSMLIAFAAWAALLLLLGSALFERRDL